MNISFESCRKQYLIIWLTGFIVILLLLLLQSVGGKYEPSSSKAWLWLLYNALPMLLALLFSYSKKNITTKKVEIAFYRVTYILLIAYFGIFLLSILTQPFAKAYADLSPLEVLHNSNIFLLPLQLVLAILFLIQATQSTQSTENQIYKDEHEGQTPRTDISNLTVDALQKKCYELLSADDTEEVFAILMAYFEQKDSDQYNGLVVLSSQWRSMAHDKAFDIVTEEVARVRFANITTALATIIGDLK